MFLLWKWSLIEGIFIISWDTNTTRWYFLPLQIVFYSAIKLHIYGWTTLCVRACHCVWVCVLPAVSHQVSMWRLNKDVVHIEQNVHEVLSGHGPAICILPLMLYTQIQVHNVIDPVFVCFFYLYHSLYWSTELIQSTVLLYLCHVDLMAGELTNLESWYMACHQDIVVGTTLNDDLRLIGGRASFISGFVVNCIFQLPTICCDLKTAQKKTLLKLCWWQLYLIGLKKKNVSSVSSLWHAAKYKHTVQIIK